MFEKKGFGCLLNQLVTTVVASSSDWNHCPIRDFFKGLNRWKSNGVNQRCRLVVAELPIFSMLMLPARLLFFLTVVRQQLWYQLRTHLLILHFLPNHHLNCPEWHRIYLFSYLASEHKLLWQSTHIAVSILTMASSVTTCVWPDCRRSFVNCSPSQNIRAQIFIVFINKHFSQYATSNLWWMFAGWHP